jgi:drug/metabolite transporter (DMT)-like permease
MNAVGMTAGAAVLLVVSILTGDPLVLPQRVETWLAICYLVVIGSVVVFLLYLFVLGHWAATRAAYGFVLIPFVTVLLSAWLDSEPVTIGLVFGGLLVLLGCTSALCAQCVSSPRLRIQGVVTSKSVDD